MAEEVPTVPKLDHRDLPLVAMEVDMVMLKHPKEVCGHEAHHPLDRKETEIGAVWADELDERPRY